MFLSRKKYDIVSVGSAVYDVYLESKHFRAIEDESFVTGTGLCLDLGAKLSVDKFHLTTGGGALNTAITFANQGLSVALAAKIGNDANGTIIQHVVREHGIATDFLTVDTDRPTTMSILLHATKNGERSVISCKGASAYLNAQEMPIAKVLSHTNWLYITHIPEGGSGLFEELVMSARRKGVAIALNPGKTQLKMGHDLVPLLANVSVFFVNQEEASLLTGVEYEKEDEVFSRLDEWVDGLVVMTKGKQGVSVSDGKTQWSAPCLPDAGFVDRTGAGDAFGSGFTSVLLRHGSVEEAIQVGSANATAVLREWGANRGLLQHDDSPDRFGTVDIVKTKL